MIIDEIMALTGRDRHSSSLLAVRYLVKDTSNTYDQVSEMTGIKRGPLFAMWLTADNRMTVKNFLTDYKTVRSHFKSQ